MVDQFDQDARDGRGRDECLGDDQLHTRIRVLLHAREQRLARSGARLGIDQAARQLVSESGEPGIVHVSPAPLLPEPVPIRT